MVHSCECSCITGGHNVINSVCRKEKAGGYGEIFFTLLRAERVEQEYQYEYQQQRQLSAHV